MLGREEKRNRAGVVTEEGTGHMALIQKIDSVMGELVTLKNAVLLRAQTRLLPERRNRTRWYSIFNMLLKWLRIRNAVAAIQHFPVAVLNLIPTANENAAIQHLVEILKKFESVSKVQYQPVSQALKIIKLSHCELDFHTPRMRLILASEQD
jgi:hypothetical protein